MTEDTATPVERSGILFLDCEIKRAIVMEGEEVDGDIETCAGWRDFENMGLASVCAMSSEIHPYAMIIMDDNHETLQTALNKHKYMVTWNGIQFDGPLLEHSGFDLSGIEHVDLLRLMWEHDGLDPDAYESTSHGGYSLGAICEANGLAPKIGHGRQAPIQFQRKEYGALLTYNLDDVVKLTELVHGHDVQGFLAGPKDEYKLPLPWEHRQPWEQE